MLCKKISDDNLWSMVSHLLEGLADYQSHSSSGSCVVLNGIVKTRVSTLIEQVIPILVYGKKQQCFAKNEVAVLCYNYLKGTKCFSSQNICIISCCNDKWLL